jgi:hypothetical protein
MFLGVIVDTLAIFLGGAVGLFIKKGVPERIQEAIMKALALSAIYIGITGMMSGENTIFIIAAMVLGVILGEIIQLDDKITSLTKTIAHKLPMKNKSSTFTEGFVTGSLVMGVGALSIIGPMESGLTGNHTILYTNAVMDGVSSIILSSSLGIGVIFSGFLVFIYEAAIVIFAGSLNTLLTTPMINDINAIGSLLLLAIGLNLLDLTEIKVMNFVPALFIPMLFFFLYT